MNDRIKSWLSEHQTTLIIFLFGQLMVFGAGAASAFAYMVRLEGRISTMENRGAHYTVARMDEMRLDITRLQRDIDKNEASINRIVDVLTRQLGQKDLKP
jgi:HAMP domain-containing protein